METFKYRFSALMYVLIAIIGAVGVVVLAITLYQVIAFGMELSAVQALTITRYVLGFVVSAILITLAITFLANSGYSVKGKKLITRLGILVSSYDVYKIDTILSDRTTGKLFVIFENDDSINIVIAQNQYEDFVQAVLNANPRIEYSIKSKTSSGEDDKKNK
ncbi:MAG TPA: hypothetical protein IAB69_04630 [Candidatus Coproplasma excrementigallinarum]|uniref:Uncharacterized protein n=1 Tax=Candidatus Coproplasma excrementigallinarum TaxID=2840747 RepID=A0A9D1MKF6_9FIRM|nr:hypothetical protein [Candidatus Coproplasma excrementigallinarum]